ncbi:aspartate--tRNA(Asp/Asn) ligase [Marinicella pacifica]|uniref:Aspartate--tRNA(Asp/Asn) ligase n=1 Tax=Marinicella pacifica TaxID=1171543 RepID=A0A917CVD8_9GAMM|nr:aspartate--tRNA ligase [Marinicella pacifica]GGG00988.1 aspartate--tRNA(Asp/Asn) ligase [Marinicella pacifica]
MRSQYCSQVTEQMLDQPVEVCGWVDKRRDHGGVIFIDLRDHTGLLQVVVEPDNQAAFQIADDARYEYCLRVTGTVRKRPEGQANERLASGRIEVVVDQYEVLNEAKALPFMLDEQAGEQVRLKYRYLDLRRGKMQHNMRLRSRLTHALRQHLHQRDFLDIETPILTKATPEGARDFLVPARMHPGQFYAMPQSPQLFKQLLMMSGMDRYYQIARCFRDEDLRADRQPEFTQLDVEMAFVEQEDVLNTAEELIRSTFKEVLDIDLPNPFPRMTYAETMRRYGSDKPDLRIDLELVDIAEAVKETEFKVFSAPANDANGRVAVLKVPQGGQNFTRKQIDDYEPFVKRYGARGLAWIKVNDKAAGRDGLQSPIVKFLNDEALAKIIHLTAAEDGDLLFFGAGKYEDVSQYMGALRLKIGEDTNRMAAEWRPLWVVDFPMFEYNADEKRWDALHHPFTAPACDINALKAAPDVALSKAYDMVLNGVELGGGSIRIHQSDVQSAVFELLDISAEQAREKFGFLLDALDYGCPPMGGIAFGVDRMAALMCGEDSIREVIAFPKTASGACPLTEAPSDIDSRQLADVHIQTRLPEVDE